MFEKRISEAKLRAKKRESEAAMAAAAERNREFQRQEAVRRAQRERDRQARAQREAARRSTNRAGRGPAGGGSQYFSFSLKNECRQTVRMFVNNGGNPRFSGGTGTTMSANSIRSFSGSESKTYWIVNSSGEGISSFTAGPGQRDMRILPSCTGFAPR